MKNRYSRKMGFTLAEVLVTLAIIAVMAAVLLPALNSQVGKGDAGRLASDLTAIQTGAQAFLSDVHRYPLSVSDLTTAISSGGTDLLGQPYPAALAAKWKGPYLSKDVVAPSGIGTISGTFLRITSLQNGVPYLAVNVANVAVTDFYKIEELLDEGNLSSTSSTTGIIRYSAGSSSFLALPIQ